MNLKTAGAAKDLSEGLPQIRTVCEKLLNGEHISRDDHTLFKEIRENHDAYTTLFAMILAEELNYHTGGFYYVREEDVSNMSERSKSFAALAICLIEQMGNRGMDASQLIDKAELIDQDFLDLMLTDQKTSLKQLNLHHRDEFTRTLTAMSKKGFLELTDTGIRSGITLKPPFHRYIDAARLYEKNHATDIQQEELL